MFDQNKTPIVEEQLPPQSVWVRQTSQGANYNKDISQRESSHKGPLYQTPQLPDEVFEGDNTSIRRDPLSRGTENLTNNESQMKRCEECCELPTEMDKSKHLPSEYENKKSVQFKSPQKDQDENNTLYHNSVVHDPILITPRHPYTNSLGDDTI